MDWFGAAHHCMSFDVVAVAACCLPLPAAWQQQRLQRSACISGNAQVRSTYGVHSVPLYNQSLPLAGLMSAGSTKRVVVWDLPLNISKR
jgi:hypothetical protein